MRRRREREEDVPTYTRIVARIAGLFLLHSSSLLTPHLDHYPNQPGKHPCMLDQPSARRRRGPARPPSPSILAPSPAISRSCIYSAVHCAVGVKKEGSGGRERRPRKRGSRRAEKFLLPLLPSSSSQLYRHRRPRRRRATPPLSLSLEVGKGRTEERKKKKGEGGRWPLPFLFLHLLHLLLFLFVSSLLHANQPLSPSLFHRAPSREAASLSSLLFFLLPPPTSSSSSSLGRWLSRTSPAAEGREVVEE